MKFLYIVRHAKSSWDEFDLNDFERPLNERGKSDAPRMATRLKEKAIVPDLMLSSPAKRAFSTAKRMAKVLGYDKKEIITDRKLYHADNQMILSVVQSVKTKYNTLLVFGHNPGLTEFVNSLNIDRTLIDNVPTCGVVAFSIDIESWSDLKSRSGNLLFFDFPKNREDQ